MLGILALVLSLFGSDPAAAQGCGPQNPNCIVPTAPLGTSNNQAASTEFVNTAIGGSLMPANTVKCNPTTSTAAAINCSYPTINVKDYGAVGDGSTDDTTAINNAIAALPLNGGEVVFPVPSVCYKTTSSLGIGNGNSTPTNSTRQSIVLKGVGNSTTTTTSGFSTSNGPRICWAGTSGAVISVNGPLQGWGVQGLNIDCGSIASTVGIRVAAGVYGDNKDIALLNCQNAISTVSYPNRNTMHNSWRNIFIQVPTISFAAGVTLDGDGVGTTSNTSFEHFENLTIYLPATLQTFGINLRAEDSSKFYNVHLAGGGASTVGIQFDYSATGVGGTWPADTMLSGIEPDGTINAPYANNGTPGASATSNTIYGHGETNGAVLPNLPNLTAYGNKKIVFSPGANNNNTSIVPTTAPGAAVSFQIPNVSGTPAISVPTPLSLNAATGAATWSGLTNNGILFASSTTSVDSTRCTMDSGQNVACTGGVTANNVAVTGATAPTIGMNTTVANTLNLYTRGLVTAQFTSDAAAVNFPLFSAKATGNSVILSASGTDTNIGFIVATKGTNGVDFRTDIAGTFPVQFSILHTASATRVVQATGSNGGNPVLQTNGGGLNLAPNNGHVPITGGTAPTLTAGCNGAGSVVSGTDAAGTITGQTAAATTCTLTFGTAYSATPNCVASGQTSPLTGAFTPSTTTLVVNFASTANYKWSYICFGS